VADTYHKEANDPRETLKQQLGPRSEHTMFVALLVLVMLVAVPLLSLRYGVDSRHFSTRERRSNW
jgi:hypothetical protein